MNNWKKYKLGDLVLFQRGHDLTVADITPGSYPVAGSNGPIGFHSKYTTKGPSLTIGRSGNSIGVAHFYQNDFWAHNTTLYAKEFFNCNPKFLFYFLKTLDLGGHNSGSAVPSLNRNYINPIEVSVPDLPTQTRIASILSSLDDKIELNRRTNHTLEQMAQTLFKKYFVTDIDPDNLPEGWRWGKLGEMIELVYGKSLKEENRKGGKYPVVGSSGIVGYHNEFIADANGIVVGRKGNAGSVIWLHENFFPIDTTFFVSDLLNVNSNHFYYLLLNTFDLGSLNSDSAVPGLNRNEAHKQNTIIPEKTFIENFNKLVEPLFEMIKIREKEINNLTKVRDSLLPKLMSGEITVN